MASSSQARARATPKPKVAAQTRIKGKKREDVGAWDVSGEGLIHDDAADLLQLQHSATGSAPNATQVLVQERMRADTTRHDVMRGQTRGDAMTCDEVRCSSCTLTFRPLAHLSTRAGNHL